MLRFLKPLLFLPFTMLLSCSDPASIEGFDSEKWKSDRSGCNGTRQQMQQDFERIRMDLYGRPEQDIKDILGRADGEALMARGQRVFYYYFEPGAQCQKKNILSEANRAEVRFNALSKVSEITYKRPIAK